jgi:phosphoglycerate dehydrogenase-like enzyme
MTTDVLCLRPESDFLAVGVTPPPNLGIAYRGPSDPDVPELVKSARALVIPAVGPAIDPALFRGTQLKLVQVTGAGLDRVDRAVLADEGIALANVPGGSNAALAEYVVTNAIALSRGFFSATAPLRAGDYARTERRWSRQACKGWAG